MSCMTSALHPCRTEFRVWHEGPDVFYIMFEKVSLPQSHKCLSSALFSFFIGNSQQDLSAILAQPLDDASKPHMRVRVDQFPVGSKLINELMSKLMEEVKQHPAVLKEKLYQV